MSTRISSTAIGARFLRSAARPRPVPQPLADRPAPQARERQAARTEDTARYHCQCGFVFDAPVSASVGCPHCGDAQAW